jgi:AraC-like DNA-binding protein
MNETPLAAEMSHLRQQLLASCPAQQLAFGDEVWPLSQLLTVLDYALRSAPDLKSGLELWCEGISLLGLPWYPQLSGQEQQIRLSFLPLQEERPLPTLWFLLQLLHRQLATPTDAAGFMLEWPERQKMPDTTTDSASEPLAVRYGPLPVFHLPTPLTPYATEPALADLHAPLATLIHRLHRLGSRPRSVLEQLKQWLDLALPEQLTLEALASRLQISTRTLQRQLGQQQTSYSRLLEEVRKNRAVSLLCHSRYSAQEVGLRLGYLDAPSFQRAFRHWFGLPPGEFRHRYFAQDNQPQLPPVVLYYAINELQEQSLRQYNGARVWICIRNLAFDKSLQLQCEDHDGIWRPYAATFERFLSGDVELWSTPSLPVHHPMRFRIEYRVGGHIYLDNNGGQDYCLDTPVLLGPHAALCHQLLWFAEGPGTGRLVARLFTRQLWQQGWALWSDGRRHPLHPEPCGNGVQWQLSCSQSSPDLQLRFEFLNSSPYQHLPLDNQGEGFLPRRL